MEYPFGHECEREEWLENAEVLILVLMEYPFGLGENGSIVETFKPS